MKASYSKTINNRLLSSYNPIEHELALCGEQGATAKNYLFDLSHLSILSFQGDKAGELLQGQLTCDVNTVSDSQIAQGAQCNLQGRILTLMDIVRWQDLHCVVAGDLVAGMQKSLQAVASLSRVKMAVNPSIKVVGFYLQNPKDLQPCKELPMATLAASCDSNLCIYHLGAGFYILLVAQDKLAELIKPFADKGQLLGSLTWHSLRLMQRQVDIYESSSGLFLPHRLDLHLNHYVSFNKGCYKGQEIIIRMEHRSQTKHSMQYFAIHTQEELYAGQHLLHATDERVLGELIDHGYLADDRFILAGSLLKEPFTAIRLQGRDGRIGEVIEVEPIF